MIKIQYEHRETNRQNRYFYIYFTFSHLADAFIQSDLQIRKSNYNQKFKL